MAVAVAVGWTGVIVEDRGVLVKVDMGGKGVVSEKGEEQDAMPRTMNVATRRTRIFLNMNNSFRDNHKVKPHLGLAIPTLHQPQNGNKTCISQLWTNCLRSTLHATTLRPVDESPYKHACHLCTGYRVLRAEPSGNAIVSAVGKAFKG